MFCRLLAGWSVATVLVAAIFLSPSLSGKKGLETRGGSGVCYWTDYPACPPPAGFCNGCGNGGGGGNLAVVAAPNCANPNGQLWKNRTYQKCATTSFGLLECGLPFVIHCHTDRPCEPKCVLVPGNNGWEWRCTSKLDAAGNVIEIPATPQNSTSASGDLCGVA